MSDSTQPTNSESFHALVICPDGRPAVPALARCRPLVLAPFLGKTVLEHALTFLAAQGAKTVTLLAGDRADIIRSAVGNGETWGVKLEVISERRELTAAEALAKHGAAHENDGLPAVREALVLDQLPQLPLRPLWESYPSWYNAMLALLPLAAKERVGMREVAPGVFVGMRSRIADNASLNGPCWIGANVFIGPRAVIGPGTVIEDGAYVEAAAEVNGSVIGPQTYIGTLTEVRHSFAWGHQLLNLRSGSFTAVADRFLLADLASPSRSERRCRDEIAEPAHPAVPPANLLRHALATTPGFWRKWAGRANNVGNLCGL